MPADRKPLQEALRRKLASAKAAQGYTWKDIAQIMTSCGVPVRANNLMAKMSRGGLKATEMVLIMRLLGNRFIDLSDVDVPGLSEALREFKARESR
jgi:hypothetical protein